MKVAFTGSGSSGKTSIATRLSDSLGIPFIGSSARRIFDKYGWVERDLYTRPSIEVYNMQFEILEAYLKSIDGNTSFITDRSPVDHLCYILYRCNRVMSKRNTLAVEKRVIDELRQFDFIFYCPFDFVPVTEDGVRDTSYAYNMVIDLLIQGVLSKNNISFITVPQGTIAERCVFVEQAVAGASTTKDTDNSTTAFTDPNGNPIGGHISFSSVSELSGRLAYAGLDIDGE